VAGVLVVRADARTRGPGCSKGGVTRSPEDRVLLFIDHVEYLIVRYFGPRSPVFSACGQSNNLPGPVSKSVRNGWVRLGRKGRGVKGAYGIKGGDVTSAERCLQRFS